VYNLVSFLAYNSVCVSGGGGVGGGGGGGSCLYPFRDRNNFSHFTLCGEIVRYFGLVT
jgi:hypothetical protein